MNHRHDVLISFVREDAAFARQLASHFSGRGVRALCDDASIATGDSLVDSLSRAVHDAKYFVVIMSPAYFASRWAIRELELALQEEIAAKRVKVLPVLYKDCEIPGILAHKMHADCRTPEAVASALTELELVLTGRPASLAADTQHGAAMAIGSMPCPANNPAELRELQGNVQTFIQSSSSKFSAMMTQEAAPDNKLCFIAMPFGLRDLNDIYEYYIKPCIERDCKLRCQRVDDIFGPNVIMDDIRQTIERCRMVVADLTGRNPNVFYEVGIAHTLKKPVLLICQELNDIPFDLRHIRVLLYNNTAKGLRELELGIVKSVNAILSLSASSTGGT